IRAPLGGGARVVERRDDDLQEDGFAGREVPLRAVRSHLASSEVTSFFSARSLAWGWSPPRLSATLQPPWSRYALSSASSLSSCLPLRFRSLFLPLRPPDTPRRFRCGRRRFAP